ncbi:hypothetical protein OAO01_04445, partial [Oligoflexia bacterium]|nr:hypothetical protein [Oligoflexia bacterium]
MKKRQQRREHDDQSFWTAYSDVMAGLLLMFVLILSVSAQSYQSEEKEKEVETKELQQEKEEFKVENVKFKNTSLRGDCIKGVVMDRLNENLSKAMGKDKVSRYGNDVFIIFDNVVRFNLGQATLPSKAAQQAALQRIKQARDQFYLTPHADSIIDKIQIVGRTDLIGDALYNMVLSIKRGGSVMDLLSAA